MTFDELSMSYRHLLLLSNMTLGVTVPPEGRYLDEVVTQGNAASQIYLGECFTSIIIHTQMLLL